jgi:hypothetical protein
MCPEFFLIQRVPDASCFQLRRLDQAESVMALLFLFGVGKGPAAVDVEKMV